MMANSAKLHEIMELVGDIDAARAEAILATGATLAEIEEAQAWAAGESDGMADVQRQPSGVVAAVLEILSPEDPLDDRD